MEKQTIKINDITYNLYKTNKFKTTVGIISLSRPLNKEDITYYTLINRLIGASSNKYKTKKELSNKMFELYDCSCFLYTSYSYKAAKNNFVFRTINQNLVNSKTLLKDTIELLKEIMFNPFVDEGGFNEHNFLEEKKALENDIKNIYNNKRRYGYNKLLLNIDSNDYISLNSLGDLDVLATIDRKKLFDFYINMLNDSMVSVGLIGDLELSEVEENFKDLIIPNHHQYDLIYSCNNIKEKQEVLRVTEKQENLIQAVLYMGYRFDLEFKDKLYPALLLFNQMFGAMFSSSLSQIVREKYSLTYDIQSDLNMGKKLLVVGCGLAKENIDKTINLVNDIFKDYNEGKIEEELLEVAKDSLISELLDMEDSPTYYLAFEMDRLSSPRDSLEEIIAKIKNTKIDEICRVSKLIKLDTIYSLVEGEENGK